MGKDPNWYVRHSNTGESVVVLVTNSAWKNAVFSTVEFFETEILRHHFNSCNSKWFQAAWEWHLRGETDILTLPLNEEQQKIIEEYYYGPEED